MLKRLCWLAIHSITDFLQRSDITVKRFLDNLLSNLAKFLSVLSEKCAIYRLSPRPILGRVLVSFGGSAWHVELTINAVSEKAWRNLG
jgi:hypothetical protein